MLIRGNVKYNYNDFSFELAQDRGGCLIRYNFTLTFEDENGYEFSYEFDSIEDFKEQYQKQNTNLFKYFFNDNTIDRDSLDYDLFEWEFWEATEKAEETAPTISEINIEEINWILVEDIKDCFENDWYEVNGIIDYIEVLEKIIGGLFWEDLIYIMAGWTSIEELNLDKIQKLIENDELKYIDEARGFNDIEKSLIELAKKKIA